MSFPRYKLVPGPIDVDVPGWELTGDRPSGERIVECHEVFQPHDGTADVEAALQWANGVIGTKQVWTHVTDRGFDHWEAGAPADDTSESGTTPEHDRWTALTVRLPDDVRSAVGGPVPLMWQMEKFTEHNDRLMNRRLPADFPYEVDRGDVGDSLAALALGASMSRDIERERAHRVREAVEMGATWDQVAAALDITADEARDLLRRYADGQRKLWLGYEAEGTKPIGMDADEHAAVLALAADEDDRAGA
ncbi:hypothetical protein AB0C89_35955 [Streptomyces sp. NPDC048491]|uniref:hypothetical protein n=1 Tax=Streptomyces sp. NPDC048491 TaxID=3157207 RepID=UPI0034404420